MTEAPGPGRPSGHGPSGPRAEYGARAAAHEETLAALRRRSLRYSTLRVVTFLGTAAALLVVDVAEGAAERWAGVVAGLLGVAFLLEVAGHRRVRRAERWHRVLQGLAREGIFRLERRWAELAAALPAVEAAVTPPAPDHPFARDLDVLGKASLFRLAGPVTTEQGRAALRALLLGESDAGGAAARLEGARELAPELDLRMTFAAHGRLKESEGDGALERFLRWAEASPWLPSPVALGVAAAVLSLTLVGLLLGDLILGLPPYWLAPALVQVELLRRFWAPIRRDLSLVEAGSTLVSTQVPQLAVVEGGPCRSGLLEGIRERLGGSGPSASQRLRRLGRMLDTVASRRSVIYAAAAPVFLLDVHLALALDRWRRGSGREVRDWLQALGEWEAVSALASLAHDHPDWCDPAFGGADTMLSARALGHPLLPPDACVRNDVEVGPPGTFLLVTGSNMSGKTTLLRALGANAVLAAAGAPVCAEAFALPPLRVRTSMRVEDSLAEGVSLFMAELLRIRGIVETADAPGAPVLYLLDEILHGTNTAERRVAARAVIRHLLARGAVGAVSSHDLTLAEAPDLDAAATKVHFREQVDRSGERTRLTFDYRLRPGLATTRNALKLLDAVGLGELVEGEIPDE